MRKLLLCAFFLFCMKSLSADNLLDSSSLASSGGSVYTSNNTYNDDVFELFGTPTAGQWTFGLDTNASGDEFLRLTSLESNGTTIIPVIHFGDASLTDATIGTTSDNVANPTIYIWGDAGLRYIDFYNDGTDGIIDVSAGSIVLNDNVLMNVDDRTLTFGTGSDATLSWFSNTTNDEMAMLQFIESDSQSLPILIICDASFTGLNLNNSNDPGLLFVDDGGTNSSYVRRTSVGLIFSASGGPSATASLFEVDGSVVVVNQDSNSTVDFRVETDSDANGLFIDASADAIGFYNSAPTHYLDIDGIDRTSVTTEKSLVNVLNYSNTLTDTTTIAAMRAVQIAAPTINGAAGGGTETVTDAATVYISNQPSGSNITFTNGPWALWVDAGESRFDGRVCQAQGANVASAATLTLGTDGNLFHITGSTNIDFITTTGWTSGSIIVLKFDGILTVNDKTASPPANTAPVDIAAAYVSSSADTLTLVYDSGDGFWTEIGRSVN